MKWRRRVRGSCSFGEGHGILRGGKCTFRGEKKLYFSKLKECALEEINPYIFRVGL